MRATVTSKQYHLQDSKTEELFLYVRCRGRDLEGGQLDNCLIGLQVWPPTFSTIHTLQSPAATGTGGLSTTLPPLTDSRT